MWDRFGREFGSGQKRCANCLEHDSGEKEVNGSPSKKSKSSKKEEAKTKSTPDKKKDEQNDNKNTEAGKEVAIANEDKFLPWFMPPRRWLGPSFGLDAFEKKFNEAGQLMRVKEDDTKFEVSSK